MRFLERFPQTPSGEEVMIELRKFLASTSGTRTKTMANVDMTESIYIGLWLLRHLPVSRDTVFDVIAVIYDDFAQRHLSILSDPTDQTPSEDDLSREVVLNDIHSTFLLYLDSCHEIWAPILSTWSLQLLGQISTQYANQPIFTRDQSVNEIINIWMGCKSIQSLLNLTSRCLKSIDHSNTDAFITALLDTSSVHSPHFDWVVAHVGNTYPQTVVSEVLGLGLQNFSTNTHPVSNLGSVVGILSHLSTTHSKEVQHAFQQMLQTVLTSSTQLGERFAMPYLLQLCSSSVPLLDVLMDSVLPKVNEDTLDGIRDLIPNWIQVHFGGNVLALFALITHLLLKSTRGPKALEILINGCKEWNGSTGQNARFLVDHFTRELSSLLYESEVSHKDLTKTFPCITSLKENSGVLLRYLTDPDLHICRIAKQLVKLIAVYEGEAIGVKAIVHYLRESETDIILWNLCDLIVAVEMKFPFILQSALQIIAVKSHMEGETAPCHLRQWKNILRLIKTEHLKKFPVRLKMSEVIRDNIIVLTPFLDVRKFGFQMDVASYVVDILARIPFISENVKFGTQLTIERYLVELLFKVLSLSEDRHSEKIRNVCHISKLIFDLSVAPSVQNDALRTLVQMQLNPECRLLFQTTRNIYKEGSLSVAGEFLSDNDEFQSERYSMYVSLLKENQKRPAGVSLARIHSTSFHSGKLNKGSKKSFGGAPCSKVKIRDNVDCKLNVQLFLNVLLNVCMAKNGNGGDHREIIKKASEKGSSEDEEVSVEAMRKVALLLVEIVSPDVMFNGLPWPEEEFSKVQVERDLQIRRAFEEHPYLWDLLELVAHYSPSLCYCSVLLRALMATLMAHWVSCQEAKSNLYPIQLEWTIRLVNVMHTGKLIPPPLCFIGHVIGELKASEVLLLLKDIWWYMKIHVPVPTVFIKDLSKKFIRNADFTKVDPVFTEKLRLIILNNVETLGYLYPKLFPL